MRVYEGKKIGVEYFPGDSGGYYIIYTEVVGEQREVIITWDEMEIIKEAVREKEI